MCVKSRVPNNGYNGSVPVTGTLLLRRLIVWTFVIIIAECILSSVAYSAEPIVVNVSINGEAKGDFFALRTEDGSFLLRSEDFAPMGLLVPAEAVVDLPEGRYAALCRATGVTCRFQEKTVSLLITVPGSLLPKAKTIVQGPTREKDVYQPRETSLFLNYGMNYSFDSHDGFRSYTLANKLGARNGNLLFLTDSLYLKTASQNEFVRLMSSATYERRPELQRITVGDSFAYSGGLGSTVNLGGIGFSKTYSIDPNFIKQPTASLSGIAEFPSQALLYMDGRLVGTYRIQPGEFQLKDLLAYTGTHDYELVIRDAFGNERRISHPNYFSDLLLRQGLHEYSYTVGFLREAYGTLSNEYGDAALSAFHRYGVNSLLTIGARAESTKGLLNGGVQASLAIPYAGAFALEAAKSREDDRKGSAYSLQHFYEFKNISTSFTARSFSKGYVTVGAMKVPNTICRQGNVTAQYGIERWGSVAVSHSLLRYFDDGERPQRTSTATINTLFGNIGYVSLSGQKSNDNNYSVFLTFTYTGTAKGPYFSATAQHSRDMNSEAMQVYNRTPVGEGVAYRASMTRSESNSRSTYAFDPYLQYNSPYGIYSMDARLQSGSDALPNMYTLSASGSLVLVDRYLGVSRPVDNSFSVVMADNLPHVPVLLNNEKIGETNSSGIIVLPTIKSYYNNQVSIDAGNVPMEYGMAGVTAKISPSQWSGSCISFEVNKLQSVTGMLFAVQEGKKKPVEFYDITMKVEDKEVRFPTGLGGEFYLDNVYAVPATPESPDEKSCSEIIKHRASGGKTIKPGTYPAFVEFGGQKCTFSITFPATEDIMTDLGKIVCTPGSVQPNQIAPAEERSAIPPSTAEKAAIDELLSNEDDPPRSFVMKLAFGKDGKPSAKKDREALALIVRLLQKNPELEVEIEVSGDRHGSEEASLRTGMKKAEAIRHALIAAGIKAGRIRKAEGVGKAKLICTYPTTACDRANRRAVVRIVQDAGETR